MFIMQATGHYLGNKYTISLYVSWNNKSEM